MKMNRRNFLAGMGGILASGMAPAVLPAGRIMRIKPVLTLADFEIPLIPADASADWLFREELRKEVDLVTGISEPDSEFQDPTYIWGKAAGQWFELPIRWTQR